MKRGRIEWVAILYSGSREDLSEEMYNKPIERKRMDHASVLYKKVLVRGKNMYKGPEKGVCVRGTAGWLE